MPPLLYALIPLLLTLSQALATTPAESHPRLLFPKSGEAAVKTRIQTDPLAADIYHELLRRADLAIKLPTCRYHLPDGKRLLTQSRNALGIILHTSMAWRLTGEKKYLDRAVKELDAAAALKNWNPKHFLDTAEMSTAVAIGYDWLYPALSNTQRHRYTTALRQKGLYPARQRLTSRRKAWWTSPRNNWTQVCTTGLLFAERALERPGTPAHPARIAARNALHQCRKFYQPSGGYPEGPGYWHYGSNYHTLALALCATDPHTELHIPTPPEFKTSPLFPKHLTGSTGRIFNFADSSPATSYTTAAQSWMAREFNDPATCQLIRTGIANDLRHLKKYHRGKRDRFFPLHLLWLPPAPKEKHPPLPPLDSSWRGSQPLATFRESWTDPNAIFVAIKGGQPGTSHGQMDVGTFVLDCDGIRWVTDLGKDNYNLPGYFDYTKPRWTYFRLNNFSHNTLVIGGKLQNPKAKPSPLTDFQTRPDSAHATFDLTPAYLGQAKKITRTCQLDRKHHHVTITDTIHTPTSHVRWAILTTAKPTITGNTVTLTRSGKQLKLTRLDPHGGRWQILPATPKRKTENQNKGTSIITFTTPATPKLQLKVRFSRQAKERRKR